MVFILYLFSYFTCAFDHDYIKSVFEKHATENIRILNKECNAIHRQFLIATGTLLYAQSLYSESESEKKEYKNWYIDLAFKNTVLVELLNEHADKKIAKKDSMLLDSTFLGEAYLMLHNKIKEIIHLLNRITLADQLAIISDDYLKKLFSRNHNRESYFHFILWAVLKKYGQTAEYQKKYNRNLKENLFSLPLKFYELPSIKNYCSYRDIEGKISFL